MKALTYLLCIIFWEVFCFGGAAYLVVWKSRSGWWIVAAFVLSTRGIYDKLSEVEKES